MGDKRSPGGASCSVVSNDDLTFEEFQCSGRIGRRFALTSAGVVIESGGGGQADSGPLLFKEVTSKMSRLGSAADPGASVVGRGGEGGGGGGSGFGRNRAA